MKLNKWTIGLAALGVVSLASAVKAEENGNAMMTALSSTTFSGYVDTSAHWNIGTSAGNGSAGFEAPYKFNQGKSDGFNLNVVQLTIAKPLDESEWAAGYHVDLWFGPDANALKTGSPSSGDVGFENSDLAIRQAYVALRMPIGNGIDWKIGVFDSIIGYESVASPNNPNYTRSYGHTMEPQTHTGLLATYRFCDAVSVAAGIANTTGPAINYRSFTDDSKAESSKTYMGSIALTAPDSWGFLAGSTLYGGVVNGWNDNEAGNDLEATTTSWYAGATLATPVTGLRFGASYDYLKVRGGGAPTSSGNESKETWSVAGYASYQATEKLSLHLRGELLRDQAGIFGFVKDNGQLSNNAQVFALTGTIQYDLWKNVISRLEVRWDHGSNGRFFGAAQPAESRSKSGNFQEDVGSDRNAVLIAANIIYKF